MREGPHQQLREREIIGVGPYERVGKMINEAVVSVADSDVARLRDGVLAVVGDRGSNMSSIRALWLTPHCCYVVLECQGDGNHCEGDILFFKFVLQSKEESLASRSTRQTALLCSPFSFNFRCLCVICDVCWEAAEA